MNWTLKDLEKKGLKHNHKPTKSKTKFKVERKSVEKDHMATVLFVLHRDGVITDYEEELVFHPVRKWRFDWAIPELKIAIEYEGLMSKKSRHTTIKGYTEDTIKYNEASKLGWRVLRYTAITYQSLHEDLVFFMGNK